jgi:hypothetical protein
MNPAKQGRCIIACAVVILIAIPSLLFSATLVGLLPWSPINCWSRDVDITSGRLRYTRHIFWIPVRQTIEDSSLTKALNLDDLRDKNTEWHHAITHSPGMSNSPHYFFHSAIHQISELELEWRIVEFTPEARRASAKRVLQLWQQTGKDAAVEEYLQALGEIVMSADGKTNRITEADLPR